MWSLLSNTLDQVLIISLNNQFFHWTKTSHHFKHWVKWHPHSPKIPIQHVKTKASVSSLVSAFLTFYGLYTRWICKTNPQDFRNVPSGVQQSTHSHDMTIPTTKNLRLCSGDTLPLVYPKRMGKVKSMKWQWRRQPLCRTYYNPSISNFSWEW